MSFLRNLFRRDQVMGHQGEKTISGNATHVEIDGTHFRIVNSIDDLLDTIAVERRVALRIRTVTYGDVLPALLQRLEERNGRYSPQYRDAIHSCLVCAGCLWEFPNSYRGSLQRRGKSLLTDIPYTNIIGTTPGFERFGKSGICPQCSSKESLLVYEEFPPEQISEADVHAIGEYWHAQALKWWSAQQTPQALCDLCSLRVDRNQGYLFANNLLCEECVREKVLAGGLQKLRSNPHGYGNGLLRKVRHFRA